MTDIIFYRLEDTVLFWIYALFTYIDKYIYRYINLFQFGFFLSIKDLFHNELSSFLIKFSLLDLFLLYAFDLLITTSEKASKLWIACH